MENIFYIDIADSRFEKIGSTSDFLEKLIRKHRPALVMFDPLQAFIPDRIRWQSGTLCAPVWRT